jgi:hypothetical protein
MELFQNLPERNDENQEKAQSAHSVFRPVILLVEQVKMTHCRQQF